MRPPRRALSVLAAAVLGATAPVATASPASAAGSLLTVLSMPAGAHAGVARAVNNRGVIVGQIDSRAVRWSATGQLSYLARQSGWIESAAVAVNNGGTAVGWARVSADTTIAVWWNADGSVGKAMRVGAPSAYTGINDRGDIVGWSFDATAGRTEPIEVVNGRLAWLSDELSTDWSGALAGVADDGQPSVVGRINDGTATYGVEVGIAPPGIGGWMSLGDNANPVAISRDGTVIAGTDRGQAAIWRLGAQPHTGYPTWTRETIALPTPNGNGLVQAMSRNGTKFAGLALFPFGVSVGFFYDSAAGRATTMSELYAHPYGVNDAGVVVGSAIIPGTNQSGPVAWK
jgi:hypothetical protein